MEIILLRHGEAEDLGNQADDASRTLTPDGVAVLKASLPGFARLIKRPGQVQVWSSPLTRAVQTAEIVVRVLGTAPLTRQDCLGTGDWEAFWRLAAQTDPKACLVLVGHEPYWSQWSQRICGCSLPFKKGAAAGFKLNADEPEKGRLQWFAQPSVLRRLQAGDRKGGGPHRKGRSQ